MEELIIYKFPMSDLTCDFFMKIVLFLNDCFNVDEEINWSLQNFAMNIDE